MVTLIRRSNCSLRRPSSGKSRLWSSRVTSVTVCSVRCSLRFSLSTTTLSLRKSVREA
ncbi:hypothetical protein ebrios_46B [Escherichia phage Ebrios]|uniref:Uncharacterized protein n=1 Tax=Escherichia phage Ebrios TaxID=2099356 RepID=A0A2S2HFI7_9CAUD|nr:hypothetical protein HOS96_gp52 [Escherichia phage Ebrios]AWL54352.1 hypothetical protein ebrios_46B [Escherichia phage Ebrios]